MESKNDDVRNKLYAEYEDSLFRLIMNDAAEKEGRSFLEEREQLKQSPENQPAAEKIEKFSRRSASFLKKRDRRHEKRHVSRFVGRAAAVVLVMAAVFSTAMVTVDAFRVKVMNYLIDIQPEYTSFQIPDSSGSKGEKMVVNWTQTYLPSYIPAGYEVDSLTYTEPLKEITYSNQKNNDLYIYFTEYDSSNHVQIDTEKASVLKTVYVNGHKGTLVVKNSLATVAWNMDNNIFTIQTTENEAVAMKIAQNVKFIK